MQVKFTPSKLSSSAHLVLREALTIASSVGDVLRVGVLFRKINEGELPAQRQVSIPQISLVVLESQVVPAADRTSMADRTVAEEVVQHSSNKIA